MLKGKLEDVQKKIDSLSRLRAEVADVLRKCNRELRLKREIKHEDCCQLLTELHCTQREIIQGEIDAEQIL